MNNGGGGGGGGMVPGAPSSIGTAGGSVDGRHDDEAVLTEFISSLMDYTPTVRWRPPLPFTPARSAEFGV
jgi:transcription initiation factor TFIID subunit 10